MRYFILTFFLLLFAGAPPALAQSGDLTPAQKQEKAIKLFEEAESYYNLQEFEKALPLYKEAYLLSQEPALLYNIGQCQRQTKRYEEAIKSYRAFLRTSQDEELRPRIEAFIKEMESELKKGSTSTSGPADNNPKEKLPLPRLLLFAGGGVGGVSVVTGAISLLAANSSRKAQLAGTTDPEAIASSATLSSRMGIVSTATFVVALGASGAGYALQKKGDKEPLLSSKLLYGVSASSAGLMLGAGSMAFFGARGAEKLQAQGSQNQELVESRQQFVSQMALTADVLLVAAVGSGVGGFLLSKKEKAKASLLLSPSSIALQVAF
jgi:tetratricopeptide (TPR) repeat protein